MSLPDIAQLEQGYLHVTEVRDAGHDCQPPMLERRIYAPVGPATAFRCMCDYGTGVVQPTCPYHGFEAQQAREAPRAYHSEWNPKGEPGTLWRCACGQPWVVTVRLSHTTRYTSVQVRHWEKTTERAVTRALRRASRRPWWRRDKVSR